MFLFAFTLCIASENEENSSQSSPQRMYPNSCLLAEPSSDKAFNITLGGSMSDLDCSAPQLFFPKVSKTILSKKSSDTILLPEADKEYFSSAFALSVVSINGRSRLPLAVIKSAPSSSTSIKPKYLGNFVLLYGTRFSFPSASVAEHPINNDIDAMKSSRAIFNPASARILMDARK